MRVLLLTHLSELLEQNADELKRINKSIEVSFFSAGLGKKKINQI